MRFLLLFLVLFSGDLIGRAKVKTADSTEVAWALIYAGVFAGHVHITDKVYTLPTSDEVFQWSKDAKKSIGKYAADVRDCDDFALATLVLARRENRGPHGIAVGYISYNVDAYTGHAINVSILEVDPQPRVLFSDPQTGKEVILTREQKQSAKVVFL